MQGYYNFFLGTVLEASVHEAFFNQSIAWEAQTQRYSRNLLILSRIFIATSQGRIHRGLAWVLKSPPFLRIQV